jgi:multidrug efflux pump subunit AcrA (membrane-fusion protein)
VFEKIDMKENSMHKLVLMGIICLAIATVVVAQNSRAPVPGSRTTSSAVNASQVGIVEGHVSLINDVDVSAQEAGVLTKLHFREGDSVEEGQLLAELDNADATVRLEESNLNHKVAVKEATNDINVQASRSAAKVAEAEVAESEAVNAQSPGSIPMTKLRRERLTAERSRLQVEVAELEFEVSGITAEIRGQQVKAAQNSLQRRTVSAPLTGVVERRYKEIGEWVALGEPICQLIRMDRLRVEGFLKAAEHPPQSVLGKSVMVRLADRELEAKLEKIIGGKLRFSGRIGFVSNFIQAGGEYKVGAEIDNLAVGSQWILRPGTPVELHVQFEDGG